MGVGSLIGRVDLRTVALYLALVILGWLSIYSSAYNEASPSPLDPSQIYGLQAYWIGFSILIAVVILLIDPQFYYVFTPHIYGFAILTLLAVLIFGQEINGAKSWIVIGPIRIQPTEFTKSATALALARYMGTRGFRLRGFRTWASIIAIIMLPAGLIVLQNDIGSAMIFSAFLLVLYREGMGEWVLLLLSMLILTFLLTLLWTPGIVVVTLATATCLLYGLLSHRLMEGLRLTGIYITCQGITLLLARSLGVNLERPILYWGPIVLLSIAWLIWGYVKRHRQVLWLVGALMLGMAASFSVDYVFDKVLSPHHQTRLLDLLGIESDPLGGGYNVNQSKIAIGSGGLMGKGFLEGTQTKFNFVPEQSTDFIFCTVGEEWGFVGSAVVLLLFLWLLLRVLRIAERQREPFHRIYGYGVATVLFVHLAVNVSMTIGLFPVIGVPLPFFSYGGSSLLAFTILLALLLRFDSARLVNAAGSNR